MIQKMTEPNKTFEDNEIITRIIKDFESKTNEELLMYLIQSVRIESSKKTDDVCDKKLFVNWIGPSNASKPQLIRFI